MRVPKCYNLVGRGAGQQFAVRAESQGGYVDEWVRRQRALAREAAEAAKSADQAKKAAVAAARETASLTSSLRKLELLKRNADAEFASADKALATTKTDQAKARAEEQKEKATIKAAEAGTKLDIANPDSAKGKVFGAQSASVHADYLNAKFGSAASGITREKRKSA